MRAHFVLHEAFEAPGALAAWVRSRGLSETRSRVYAGEALPDARDPFDLLIVMGGPQSPDTTLAECPHFDAAAECRLIADAVGAGKAVLGVCLGAQLLGTALGATHEHSPEQEIGVFPIWLTAEGRVDPLLAPLGEPMSSGHWHQDMPGLTADARVLAASAGCPRQIVRYGRLAYGFQCHLEFTADVVDALIEASVEELRQSAGRPFVQRPDELRGHDYAGMNAALFGFLDNLLAAYAASHGVGAAEHAAEPMNAGS